MSFWRFSHSSRRLGAQGSTPSVQAPDSSSSSNDCNPPRYSDLSSIVGSHTPPSHAPEPAPSQTAADADYASSRFSTVSLGSQMSTPSYATHDNDPYIFSISSSTMALTAPPRYSSWSQNVPGFGEDASVVEGTAYIPEHTFDLWGSFKSERRATLRLYDAGPRSPLNSRKGKYPRILSVDAMLGNVDLSLSSPQTIKNIVLTLKGSIITGAIGEGGSTTFLAQEYTLWDRKFGDPRQLTHDQVHGPSKYDGKLSGNWLFPFSIPFPTHVDLSTLRAIYPGTSEGPVRFLPEFLDEGRHVTPFDAGGDPVETQAVQGSNLIPFDVRVPHTLTEKGRVVLSNNGVPTQATMPQFSAIDSSTTSASSSPSLEPYTLRPLAPTNLSSSFHSPGKRRDPASPHETFAAQGRQRSGGTSMQSSKPSTCTAGHLLPQSFLERDIMANVRYEITLTITHGRFSTKSQVTTPVTYVPVTVPRPMAPGRERAYRQREIPPGPDADPGGWKQLPPVSIRGTFSDQTTLTVDYSLSLAMPLSYAQGTVLPCCLTVACDNRSALNLFANPRTPRVRLRRSTRFLRNHAEQARGDSTLSTDPFVGGGNVAPTPARPRISSTPLELSRRSRDSRLSIPSPKQDSNGMTPFLLEMPEEEEEEIQTLGPSDEAEERDVGDCAVWCTPAHFAQEPQERRLYGEIHLPRGLQPTCKFPLFNILYHVDLLAPATNAFVPDMQHTPEPSTRKDMAESAGSKNIEESDHLYISHFVEITTGKRKGEPTPIAFVGLVG